MKLVLVESNIHLAGKYQPTIIDEEKKINNRLVSIIGKYRTVITTDGKQLNFVGKREWDKWAANNEYVTDF